MVLFSATVAVAAGIVLVPTAQRIFARAIDSPCETILAQAAFVPAAYAIAWITNYV